MYSDVQWCTMNINNFYMKIDNVHWKSMKINENSLLNQSQSNLTSEFLRKIGISPIFSAEIPFFLRKICILAIFLAEIPFFPSRDKLKLIVFCWFSLIVIDFHWFSIIFFDSHCTFHLLGQGRLLEASWTQFWSRSQKCLTMHHYELLCSIMLQNTLLNHSQSNLTSELLRKIGISAFFFLVEIQLFLGKIGISA